MHPQVLASYSFRRQQQQLNVVDAVTETASYFGVSAAELAAAVLPLESGVNAERLSLLTA